MLRARVLALVATLVMSVAGCGSDEAASGGSDGRPEAPEGMQLIGAEGIVIAVPDAWVHVDSDPCLVFLPDRTYVLRESPGNAAGLEDLAERCRESGALDRAGGSAPGDESLTVGIGPQYFSFVGGADDPPATPTPLVRGDLTVNAWVQCDDLGEGIGVITCMATWSVQDEDLAFSVVVPGDGGRELLEEMDSSIRRLPDGWTTSETDGTVVRDED